MNTIEQLYTESEQRDKAMRTMLASWIRANTSPHKRGADLPLPTPVRNWIVDELTARLAYDETTLDKTTKIRHPQGG